MLECILDNQKNKGSKCANILCGFRNRGLFPKANHYDTKTRSWICTTCAQGINREELAKSQKYSTNFKQRCISSEDALVLMLKTGAY